MKEIWTPSAQYADPDALDRRISFIWSTRLVNPASQVITTRDRREDRGLHRPPMFEHLTVAVAMDAIACGPGERVPIAIGLEPLAISVMLEPVDFDDQPLAEEKVDASDSGNPHLPTHPRSHPRES